MAEKEYIRKSLPPCIDPGASVSRLPEDIPIRSSRWDSSCRSHTASSDLYSELLRNPPRRSKLRSGSPEVDSTRKINSKSSTDEDWTEATASDSFSGDASFGSSISSIGVTAVTSNVHATDIWSSPRQTTSSPPMTLARALATNHQILKSNDPLLDIDKDGGMSEMQGEASHIDSEAAPGPGRDKLRPLIEDEDEDASSSTRLEDSFQQTDDEHFLIPTKEERRQGDMQPMIFEKNSFSFASDNIWYHNDEADSYDDYSSSEAFSDDYMVDYLTTSDEESEEEETSSQTHFHAPITSIASLDKLPTRHSQTPQFPFTDSLSLLDKRMSEELLSDSADGEIVSDWSKSAANNELQLSHSERGLSVELAIPTARHSDSLDCLPKLPRRLSTTESEEADIMDPLSLQVRFAPLCLIQEYAVTVGDNPSCSGECPLTLDWEHAQAYRQQLKCDGTGRLKCLSLAARRARVMQVQNLTEQKLRLLELQIANRSSRNSLLAKMKRKQRSWLISTEQTDSSEISH